jgi:thiol:disulfide interchange protein DsbD
VAAPLAGALLYISQTRDVALGGSALFAMALGMGIPLLVVGVSEGAFLPKSGPWMVRVKHLFGVLLLAVAAWIVWPVFGPSIGGTEFVRVQSIAELEQKLRSPGKPVMLDFYADWCVSARKWRRSPSATRASSPGWPACCSCRRTSRQTRRSTRRC